jgi:hypothetical protein
VSRGQVSYPSGSSDTGRCGRTLLEATASIRASFSPRSCGPEYYCITTTYYLHLVNSAPCFSVHSASELASHHPKPYRIRTSGHFPRFHRYQPQSRSRSFFAISTSRNCFSTPTESALTKNRGGPHLLVYPISLFLFRVLSSSSLESCHRPSLFSARCHNAQTTVMQQQADRR